MWPTTTKPIISAPETPDQLHEYALWAYMDRHGETFYAGRVQPLSTRATVEDHLDAKPLDAAAAIAAREEGDTTLTPNSIIMRTNKDKVRRASQAFAALTDEEKDFNARRPLYWLKWQRDAGAKEVRGSLWDKSGRYGAFLDGTTQYPLEREQDNSRKYTKVKVPEPRDYDAAEREERAEPQHYAR